MQFKPNQLCSQYSEVSIKFNVLPVQCSWYLRQQPVMTILWKNQECIVSRWTSVEFNFECLGIIFFDIKTERIWEIITYQATTEFKMKFLLFAQIFVAFSFGSIVAPTSTPVSKKLKCFKVSKLNQNLLLIFIEKKKVSRMMKKKCSEQSGKFIL